MGETTAAPIQAHAGGPIIDHDTGAAADPQRRELCLGLARSRLARETQGTAAVSEGERQLPRAVQLQKEPTTGHVGQVSTAAVQALLGRAGIRNDSCTDRPTREGWL